MFNLIVEVQYVEAANCFLHLPTKIFNKLNSYLSKSVKGLVINCDKVVYFTTAPTACHWLADDVVGISAVYASLLQLFPGDKLILTPLSSSPSLSRVIAYPLSEDDHQILEIASEEVASTLLNQLQIVWPKQCFPAWVSPSITAKLVVDSITPSIEFGSLVEDTEIVIGEAKVCKRLVNQNAEYNLCMKDTSISSNLPLSNVDNLSKKEHLFESVVCRLVPFYDFSPPYLVTLSPKDCPGWIKNYDASSVFQLMGCVDPYSKVFVNISIENYSVEDVGPYKSLTVSYSVFYSLSLGCGSKVLLSPLKQSSNELTSLLITPCAHLKKTLALNEVENQFRKKLSSICLKWGRCLLNSKGAFLLDENSSVTVTLRPLNLEWAFVTLISLYSLPISVDTVETSSSFIRTDQECYNESVLSCFCKSLSSDISSLLEHSLRLKGSLKKKPSFKNNFLIVGKHGCGKTYISNHFLSIISKFPYYIHFEKIDCTSLKGKRIENVGKIISSHLMLCKQKQPAVLLLENIEIVCGTFSPELEKAETSFHIQRVSQKVADLLENLTLDSSVLVFATCENINAINNALFKRRGHSLFSIVVPIQPSTLEERKLLMESTILNKTLNTEDSLKELDLGYYASLTESYVSADLIRFIEKAIFEATQNYSSLQNEPVLTSNDLKAAFESSSSFMNNKLKVQKHYDVKLSDVGGLKKVKEKLIEIVVWPSKYGSLLNQCPLKKQTGVLLYGAPGSGKTMLARAIAQESNLNFITVKGPELMSKYIGESEEGVRRVFENAQAAKPSLLFFDEFESLAPRRGEEQTGVTDRVVNQLLTALDGVEPISGVIVVAASSRPDLIDPALLRPGRLSHHLFCSFPDLEERYEILNALTKSVNMAEDVDLKGIAQLTNDFSGADLKGLLTTAQIQVLDKLVDSNPDNGSQVLVNFSNREVRITQEDLAAALMQSNPSLNDKQRLHFSSIYKMFSKGKVIDITNQRAIFA